MGETLSHKYKDLEEMSSIEAEIVGNTIDELHTDNARLRALIKEAEFPDMESRCPWCNCQWKEPAHLDCRAFNKDGVVR